MTDKLLACQFLLDAIFFLSEVAKDQPEISFVELVEHLKKDALSFVSIVDVDY